MRPRRFLLWLAALALILWLRCANPGMVGGGDDSGSVTEVIALSGTVVGQDGAPAAGVAVAVRPQDYLKDPFDSLSPFGPGRIRDTVTDDQGRFSIPGLDTGEYCLEAYDQSQAVITRFRADGRTATVALPPAHLEPHCSVSGTLRFGVAGRPALFLQVYGLSRCFAVDSGAFTAAGLPAGSVRLRFIADSRLLAPVEPQEVDLVSGQGLALGTIELPSFWDEDYGLWPSHDTLTLNTTASGAGLTGIVTRFPLLVRLGSNSSVLSGAQPDGRDLRFSRPDGTRLFYEIEQWAPAAGQAAVWVLVDTVKADADSQKIFVHWGNPDCPDRSDGAGVFDTADGYLGVWHLGGADYRRRADATAARRHGTPLNFDRTESTSGLIGLADNLTNATACVDVGPINPRRELTLYAWVRSAAVSNWARIISKPLDSDAEPWKAYALMCDSTSDNGLVSLSEGRDYHEAKISAPGPGQWALWCGTYDGALIRSFLNGQAQDSTAFNDTLQLNQRHTLLGAYDPNGLNRYFGTIDEVRICRHAQSADWIRLCFMNQRQNDALVRW